MKTNRDFYKELALCGLGGSLIGIGTICAIEGYVFACLGFYALGIAALWKGLDS